MKGRSPVQWLDHRIQDSDTKTKLVIIIMVTVLISLFLTGIFNLAKDFVLERGRVRSNLEVAAEIISSNSTAALTFQDGKALNEILSALKAKPNIQSACIYDPSYRIAGTFVRPDQALECPAQPSAHDEKFKWRSLSVILPIILDGKKVGTVYIQSDLNGMYLSLLFQAIEILFISLLTIAFAFFFSNKIQYLVSKPIFDLARTAEMVSSHRDYSIRATEGSRDEMGLLINAFNHMLIVIEESAKEREQLLADARSAIQVRDDFMAIASHELRTPITPLKAQVQIIERLVQTNQLQTYPTERLKKLLSTTDLQLSRLSSLIDDLLDVTRIASGKFTLNCEELSFNQLVREVVERFHPTSSAPVHLDLEGEFTGMFDRLRMEQVVINLLTNALKYGIGKPVLVTTRKVGERVILTVQDQGVGIKTEDQSRIFQRFERAVSIRHFGGLGLGLFIVSKITEAHGGRISVESQVGKGSKFIVEFPQGLRKAA